MCLYRWKSTHLYTSLTPNSVVCTIAFAHANFIQIHICIEDLHTHNGCLHNFVCTHRHINRGRCSRLYVTSQNLFLPLVVFFSLCFLYLFFIFFCKLLFLPSIQISTLKFITNSFLHVTFY